MSSKSVLLAIADPQALIDITQALGAEWEATSVATETDAFEQLEQRSFDALLVDFNLGSPDGSELLNKALERRPETTRFLLSYEADLALVAAKVLGTPHILAKPIEPGSLKNRIENAVNESNAKPGETASAEVRIDPAAVPAIYPAVLKALESPGVTNEEVGELIAQDPDLSSEVLRLTNSSYLGLPRNVTDPVEAVESLGLDAVKALVMALQFLAEHSRLKPGYLSINEIWEHSVNVAQIARDLVLFETKDRALASQALTAGLLHDLGKIVLATNFDDLYGRVHSLARKQPVTLWDVEKEMFGANHGEIGACLVGMWNLPSAIIDATAMHHEPSMGEEEKLTALAAVHIANVLEHQLRPSDDDMMVAPIINTTFLNELGLLQRLPVWRAAFANRRAEDLETQLESDELDTAAATLLESESAPRTANDLQPPPAATRTSTSGRGWGGDEDLAVQAARYRKTWAYAGAAAVLILVGVWFRTQSGLDDGEQVYARTPMQQLAPAVVASTPAPQTIPAPQPEVSTNVAVAEPAASAPPSETLTKPTALPEAAVPAVTNAVGTNLVAATVPPQPKPLPEFKLNGIIYATTRPSAIVNGRTVAVGDQVNGATVIGIGPSTVTLRINGQRRTYELQ